MVERWEKSVPKTLIQYLIAYVARTQQLGAAASEVLDAVLRTTISPELVPGAEGSAAVQSTEAVIGPYELQDFHLYYLVRFGYSPSKVAFLSWCAWRDRSVGHDGRRGALRLGAEHSVPAGRVREVRAGDRLGPAVLSGDFP